MTHVFHRTSILLLILGYVFYSDYSLAEEQSPRDACWTIQEMNKAQVLMLQEKGILPTPLASKIASAIRKVNETQNKKDGDRPTDYLNVEKAIIAVGGAESSRLHSGRSRQDMKSTTERMFMRDSLLDTYSHLDGMRKKLLELAGKNLDTIIPSYTHGVQAQPTTLAHYALAWAQSFDRDAERLRAIYGDINQSPLGSAAGIATSFDIDRERLAKLLGFDGIVENTLDANYLSPVHLNTEYASTLAMSALTIEMFAQDLHIQYHQPQPWILIKEGPPLTGISSIMPQKRNPSALENVRMLADRVICDNQMTYLQAHKTTLAMNDYRSSDQALNAAKNASKMYELFGMILDALIVNSERSLEEVNSDYSTTSELANTLQQVANVPFRIGHHFASELTNYGRTNKLKPNGIPFDEAKRIYKKDTGKDLPLTEEQFRNALSASHIIVSSKSVGGPQPSEVKRMLANEAARLTKDDDWLNTTRNKLSGSESSLQGAFSNLADKAK